MNVSRRLRGVLPSLLILSLLCALMTPVSAFFWDRKDDAPRVEDFSKNGLIGADITFSPEDFTVKSSNKAVLKSITLLTLPDAGAGSLSIGGQLLEAGSVVDSTALSGLRFQSAPSPTVTTTAFTFTPSFSTGQEGETATVTLYLLTQANNPPVARNMELSTYKNVAVTGWFDAVDGEGDVLTYQLTSTPARGAVTMSEDGSSRFVYTPYENKTGGDSFTYVAVDPAGNVSPEAKITVRIEKPDTKVTYADLDGNSAHKAAIRLAEEGIYTGQYVDGRYFFDPDAPVSRAQFLTMAMAAAGVEPMEGVTMTGFSDDAAIPTWCKGTVTAALRAGAVQGSRDADGAPVFQAQAPVTRAEATVMLNNLLNISDVPAEVFFDGGPDGVPQWCAQAAANLAASGVLQDRSAASLSQTLTRAGAAELLDGALDVMAAREDSPWPW